MLIVGPLQAALAQKLGRKVRPSVACRMLARHGWRKLTPPTRATPRAIPPSSRSGKKLPAVVADALGGEAAAGKRPRLMFQDEARFGRMARPRRCRAS